MTSCWLTACTDVDWSALMQRRICVVSVRTTHAVVVVVSHTCWGLAGSRSATAAGVDDVVAGSDDSELRALRNDSERRILLRDSFLTAESRNTSFYPMRQKYELIYQITQTLCKIIITMTQTTNNSFKSSVKYFTVKWLCKKYLNITMQQNMQFPRSAKHVFL